MSLLSKPVILENLGRGVIIDPFVLDSLKSCSYDVRIGPWFYRRVGFSTRSGVLFNPYCQEAVERHFEGPFEAEPAVGVRGYNPSDEQWQGIDPNDLVIMINPGELILGHTLEFVGGTEDPETGRCFTAEMKARSSIGRIGFEVCRCAGWGDVGYINRWTMEIKNDDPLPAFLVVGTCVAQMKFYEVAPCDDCDLYGWDCGRDHYQPSLVLAELKMKWRPEMLLPRLTKT